MSVKRSTTKEKSTTFMDRVISSRGHLIHKLRATDNTGREAYYFLLIEPLNETAFKKALAIGNDTINLEEFGKVIASCYGDKPTKEVQKLLKEKYQFVV